jgi:uncharacterized membrane protein YkoI
MDKRTRILIGAAATVVAIGVGTGVGIAASSDDDQPLTGTDLDRATAAALEHVGGGTVIETEAGDDGAAYGVEIRREDGSVVEVRLDERFQVIGTEGDDDVAGEAEHEGSSDD